jgi:hypothetical protein
MSNFKEFFAMMAQAPDGQLAQSQALKCKQLSEQDVVKASEVKQILDDCAYYALASEFSMLALDAVWKEILKGEAA